MRRGLFLGLVALFLLFSLPARALEGTNEQLFAAGVNALEEGDYEKAISTFEAVADRGFNHPDVTYNRGLAYLARVRAKAERPGDLGRAAAAFEETLFARSSDEDAQRALSIVRGEVARRRARRADKNDIQERPSIDRAIVGLAPEAVWAWGALLSTLVLTVGLILRRTPRGPSHLAGLIATPLGLLGLVVFAPVTALARHQRHTTTPAVVVVAEAYLLNDKGASLGEGSIPEAARVEAGERTGSLVHIRYGTREGWTHATSVRLLAVP